VEDMRRQAPNVKRMGLLGTRVVGVESGSKTLKDATNAAMRDWMETSEHTHYIIGSVVGPHPFPMIVRDFQSVIGRECRAQCLEQIGRLPDVVVACVGGGSNAAGIFYPFAGDEAVKLVGVEAGGRSSDYGEHASPLCFGKPGVLHGSYSYVMQDQDGQTAPVHSISAGLDYPGVGPEHSYWRDVGRASYTNVTDAAALEALGGLAPATFVEDGKKRSVDLQEGVVTEDDLLDDGQVTYATFSVYRAALENSIAALVGLDVESAQPESFTFRVGSDGDPAPVTAEQLASLAKSLATYRELNTGLLRAFRQDQAAARAIVYYSEKLTR